MASLFPTQGLFDRGGYIAEGFEARLTERCQRRDLEEPLEKELEELRREHSVVGALISHAHGTLNAEEELRLPDGRKVSVITASDGAGGVLCDRRHALYWLAGYGTFDSANPLGQGRDYLRRYSAFLSPDPGDYIRWTQQKRTRTAKFLFKDAEWFLKRASRSYRGRPVQGQLRADDLSVTLTIQDVNAGERWKVEIDIQRKLRTATREEALVSCARLLAAFTPHEDEIDVWQEQSGLDPNRPCWVYTA